jgi:serine/threonine-protein kinase
MDFGIARAMGDSGMTMTQTSAVIGTAQYLSPEQAKGEQVDARSDLYSTGCLLYELLTVRPPFIGDSPVAVAYQHVREEPQPPSVFDPEITPEMDAIVLRALVKDPDYRYQSADEMRADIEACLDGQPVAATAAMGSVGYGGYPDDQPTTALRSDAGATTMLPPVGPDDGYGGYDDRQGRRRQQKKNNTSTILLVVAGVLVLIGAVLIGRWMFAGNGTGNDTLKAPNFVGQSEAEAKESAKNVDLNVTTSKAACENEKSGNVCKQTPQADTKVKKGDTIALVISTGAPKVTVPDVQGIQFDEAETLLQDKGFEVDKKTEESDRTAGIVIKQDPDGGKIEKGSTVTLTVAKAPDKETVPDVSRQSCDAAKAQMTANNLVGTCTEVETDDQSLVGKVVATNPEAGSERNKGDTVTIQIGKAAEEEEQPEAKVPNVVGRTVGQAKQILQAAGFTNIQFANGSDQSDTALVTDQDPDGGNDADPTQTTITLASVGFGGNNGNNNNGGGDGGGFFG